MRPLATASSTKEGLTFGLEAGLLVGGLEAAFFMISKLFGRGIYYGYHIGWMSPLAEGILFAVAGAAVGFVSARLDSHSRRSALWGVLAFLAPLSLLISIRQLHTIAIGILAAGVGVATIRAAPAVRQRIRTAIRRALVIPAATALVGGALTIRDARTREVAPGAPGSPNILLIVMDTEAAAHLQMYGYARPTSDVVGRLGESGLVFSRAYSTSSWTLPSHGSMFTGHEAHELEVDWTVPLDDRFPTVAEILGRSGYRTGGFVANLRFTNSEFGLARGFAHYDDFPVSLPEVAMSAALVRWASRSARIRRLVGWYDIVGRKRAPEINHRFLSWLDRAPDRPWFAFLNYFDAHEPYQPSEDPYGTAGARRYDKLDYRIREVLLNPGARSAQSPEARVAERDAYDASIGEVDTAIGALVAALQQRDQLDRTIIIITADHGEEHGDLGAFTHSRTLNRNAIWVPLIMTGPGLPSSRVDVPVSTRDVGATILRFAGVTDSIPGTPLTDYVDGTTQVPPPLSSLDRRPAIEYSLILDSMQYRRKAGDERLTRVDDMGPVVDDFVDDPAFADVLRNARRVLDSVLNR